MKKIQWQLSGELALAWLRGFKFPIRLMGLCVFVPTLCTALYMFVFASPMYISESMFAVRTHDAPKGQDPSAMAMALFRASSPLAAEAFILKNYVHSVELFDKVNERLHLVAHYSNPSHDLLFRLGKEPTQQERLDYWKRMVSVSFDPDTGIVSLSVRAYSAQMAQDICRAILELSEQLVNNMNTRAWHDAIGQAEAEILRASQRVAAAQQAMQQYRDEKGILDPASSAKTFETIVGVLEGEAAKTRAELAEAMSYMREDSPRVATLRAHLRAIEGQMSQQKGKLAGPADGTSKLSGVVSRYQELATELEFAQKQQVSAMTMLEQSRVSLQLKSRYVVSFVPPTLPDVPLAPQPLLATVQTFAVLLAIFGLVALIIASIREHAGF